MKTMSKKHQNTYCVHFTLTAPSSGTLLHQCAFHTHKYSKMNLSRNSVSFFKNTIPIILLVFTKLQNQSELRAPTPEIAAHYLDVALASRQENRLSEKGEERRGTHMLFTLYVYQYRMDKASKANSEWPS